MRLLNTKTYELVELSDDEVRDLPNGYAILSHRWYKTAEEVKYQEMITTNHESIKSRKGYQKIVNACMVAKRDYGHEYIWIDTCCIDKSSSSELQEAINSMWNWYQESDVCLAFLDDAMGPLDFGESLWFTRGWTLQELIAPKKLDFFNKEWIRFGSREDMAAEVSIITGISKFLLEGRVDPKLYSIAERMSWAARRKTSRVEDAAYCLMGLFDVNMPMLYGEREKAFFRLQEEIIRVSADETIFTWDITALCRDKALNSYGLLAPSPAYFSGAEHCYWDQKATKGFDANQFSHIIRSKCLCIGAGQYIVKIASKQARKFADKSLLTWPFEPRGGYDSSHAIFLSRVAEPDIYARVDASPLRRAAVSLAGGNNLEERDFTVGRRPDETPLNSYADFTYHRRIEHFSSTRTGSIINLRILRRDSMSGISTQATFRLRYDGLPHTKSLRWQRPGVVGLVNLKIYLAPGNMADGFGDPSTVSAAIMFGFDHHFKPYYCVLPQLVNATIQTGIPEHIASQQDGEFFIDGKADLWRVLAGLVQTTPDDKTKNPQKFLERCGLTAPEMIYLLLVESSASSLCFELACPRVAKARHRITKLQSGFERTESIRTASDEHEGQPPAAKSRISADELEYDEMPHSLSVWCIEFSDRLYTQQRWRERKPISWIN